MLTKQLKIMQRKFLLDIFSNLINTRNRNWSNILLV